MENLNIDLGMIVEEDKSKNKGFERKLNQSNLTRNT